MTKRRMGAVAGVLAACLMLAAPAGAGTATREDGNDSPGLLDVQRVVHGHAGDGILLHRFKTFEKWDWSIFENETFADFSFFVNGGRRVDRTLTVTTSPDGTPYAEMYDRDGDTVGYARVWKPTPRSLQVEFHRSLLGKNVDSYRWKLLTTFHEDDHEKCGTSGNAIKLCPDAAPNRGKGKIRHRLG